MRYFLGLLALTTVIFVLLFSPALGQGQAGEIKVFINDVPVFFDVQPVIQSDRILAPFRAIAEALNIEVNWDEAAQTVEATDGDTLIKLQIGNRSASKNGVDVPLDAPPVLLNGRTLIPLRFFSEAFDCDVFWDQDTYRVDIKTVPQEMAVIGFYALGGDSKTSSWTNLFRKAYPETDIGNTDVVDELALGWYSFDEQGNLLVQSWTGWQRPPGWEDVLQVAEKYGLKTEMAIHNTDRYGALSSLLADEIASAKLIEAIINEAFLYDGVNLNFEEFGFVKEGEGKDLTAKRQLLIDFVRLLSAQLKTANKSLTLTIHPLNSIYRGYDYKALGEFADRIIIMAYDYGPKPEPYSLVAQAVEMAREVVPSHKLVLGICAPYETAESMGDKVNIARRYNLQGVSLWRLGLVTQDMWQVLRDNNLKP